MPRDKTQQNQGLKWNGSGSLNDVPARDLSHDEVLAYGGYNALIESGCYNLPTASNDQTEVKE